jgi:hypothetical protein
MILGPTARRPGCADASRSDIGLARPVTAAELVTENGVSVQRRHRPGICYRLLLVAGGIRKPVMTTEEARADRALPPTPRLAAPLRSVEYPKTLCRRPRRVPGTSDAGERRPSGALAGASSLLGCKVTLVRG